MTASYIGIWITRDEQEAIFGFDAARPASVFMNRGKVLGETYAIGLWTELDAVTVPPEDQVFPDVEAKRPRRPIRWELVHSAELFASEHDLEAAADFRPLAA